MVLAWNWKMSLPRAIIRRTNTQLEIVMCVKPLEFTTSNPPAVAPPARSGAAVASIPSACLRCRNVSCPRRLAADVGVEDTKLSANETSQAGF